MTQGDREEATWLALVVTYLAYAESHRYKQDTWITVRTVYSGFGDFVLLWAVVSKEPGLIEETGRRHETAYRRLPRGNHRKFEPRKLDHPRAIGPVTSAYINLMRPAGSQACFIERPSESPTGRFDRLMQELDIPSFGRLGRFDFLVLLRNLGVYQLNTPRMYLEGATGPLRGAKRLLGGSYVDPRQADEAISDWGRSIGLDLAALEDGLCNWQKRAIKGC